MRNAKITLRVWMSSPGSVRRPGMWGVAASALFPLHELRSQAQPYTRTLPRSARHNVIPNFLQTGAWPWLRTSMQAATMVLLVFMLGPHDFGRYATALAIASIIAPLVVGGPSFVYLDSHRAFGCTREQVATVWTRSLLVFGLALAALVAVAMVVLADDRLD